MILYENTIRNFRNALSSRKLGSFLAREYTQKMGQELEPLRCVRWKYCLETVRNLMKGQTVSPDCGIRVDTMINGGQEQLMIILASKTGSGTEVALITLFPCQTAALIDMEDLITFTDESGSASVCVHPAFQAQSTRRFFLKRHDGKHESASIFSGAYLFDCPFSEKTDIRSGYNEELLKDTPIFYAGEEAALLKRLQKVLSGHEGSKALSDFYRLGQAANTQSAQKGSEREAFLSDHKMIYSEIMKAIRSGSPCWFLIEGKSGTGKSLLGGSLKSDMEHSGFIVRKASELDRNAPNEKTDLLIIGGKGKFSDQMSDLAKVIVCFYDACKLTEIKLITELQNAADRRNIPLKRFTLNQTIGLADNGKGLNWLVRHFQLADVPKREWDPSAFRIETVDNADSLPKPSKNFASVLIRKEICLDADGKTIHGSKTAKAKVYELFSTGRKGVTFFCEDAPLQQKIRRELQASKSKYDWLRQYDISSDPNGEKLAEAQMEILQNQIVRSKFEKQARGYLGETAWLKLSDTSQKCLVSALLAFHDMKEYNQLLDFSGVCIQVCKAVETELSERTLIRYISWLKKKYGKAALERAPKSVVMFDNQQRQSFKTKDAFTLGSVSALTGIDDKGEIRNKSAWQEFSEYAKNELLNKGSDPLYVFSSQLPVIAKIRMDYRNRAAHKENIDIVTAQDCLDYVVMVYRKLGELLDAYRA